MWFTISVSHLKGPVFSIITCEMRIKPRGGEWWGWPGPSNTLNTPPPCKGRACFLGAGRCLAPSGVLRMYELLLSYPDEMGCVLLDKTINSEWELPKATDNRISQRVVFGVFSPRNVYKNGLIPCGTIWCHSEESHVVWALVLAPMGTLICTVYKSVIPFWLFFSFVWLKGGARRDDALSLFPTLMSLPLWICIYLFSLFPLKVPNNALNFTGMLSTSVPYRQGHI